MIRPDYLFVIITIWISFKILICIESVDFLGRASSKVEHLLLYLGVVESHSPALPSLLQAVCWCISGILVPIQVFLIVFKVHIWVLLVMLSQYSAEVLLRNLSILTDLAFIDQTKWFTDLWLLNLWLKFKVILSRGLGTSHALQIQPKRLFLIPFGSLKLISVLPVNA